MNLYRRAVATYDTSDPDTTGWFEEIRTALHQTPPFEGSGDTHPWDGHEAPNGPELWRQCPCPHRMLLVDAVTTALAHHAIYLAGWVDACQKRADHDVPQAIDLIGHVLEEFYSRRRKLHRQYAEVVEVVLRIRSIDYAKRRRSLQRTLDRTKRQLTGQLFKAFLQYGPARSDFRREPIYWAIATIMIAYGLEAAKKGRSIDHIIDRIKKRCLKHPRSTE